MNNKLATGLLLVTLISSRALAVTDFSTLGQTRNGMDEYDEFDVMASDFTTGSSAEIITNGVFKFANQDDEAHVMTPAIYSNNHGVPGTLVGTLNSFTVPRSSPIGSINYVNYSVTAASILLQPDTTYWMAVAVDEPVDDAVAVLWAANTGQGTDSGSLFTTVSATEIQYNSDGATDYAGSWDNAPVNSPDSTGTGNTLFSLSGVTPAPEPSSALLLLGALGALPFRHRLFSSARGGKAKV